MKRHGEYQPGRVIHACGRDSLLVRHVKYERTAEKYSRDEERGEGEREGGEEGKIKEVNARVHKATC